MDIAILIVNTLAMLATIISAYFAIKAKNEIKKIVVQFNKNNEDSRINGNNKNINDGTNNGIMTQSITGGVNMNGKKI